VRHIPLGQDGKLSAFECPFAWAAKVENSVFKCA